MIIDHIVIKLGNSSHTTTYVNIKIQSNMCIRFIVSCLKYVFFVYDINIRIGNTVFLFNRRIYFIFARKKKKKLLAHVHSYRSSKFTILDLKITRSDLPSHNLQTKYSLPYNNNWLTCFCILVCSLGYIDVVQRKSFIFGLCCRFLVNI